MRQSLSLNMLISFAKQNSILITRVLNFIYCQRVLEFILYGTVLHTCAHPLTTIVRFRNIIIFRQALGPEMLYINLR